MNWLDGLQRATSDGQSSVVISIVDVQGSAPRGVGTRMVVLGGQVIDTIGGGALEQKAIEVANGLLVEAASGAVITRETFPLAKALSQCCGGHVTLQFDYTPATDFSVAIFGAGHVAQATVKILAELDCHTTVHDGRTEWLDKVITNNRSTGSVNVRHLPENPHPLIESCRANTYYLVMTHSHELDFDCVEAIISRGDARYCGLIASKSKAAAFRSRLGRKQFSAGEIESLTAPIGQRFKTGSQPMEVALAAVTELLLVRQKINANEQAAIPVAIV